MTDISILLTTQWLLLGMHGIMLVKVVTGFIMIPSHPTFNLDDRVADKFVTNKTTALVVTIKHFTGSWHELYSVDNNCSTTTNTINGSTVKFNTIPAGIAVKFLVHIMNDIDVSNALANTLECHRRYKFNKTSYDRNNAIYKLDYSHLNVSDVAISFSYFPINTQLQMLNLSFNNIRQLKNVFPSGLASLKDILDLDLSYNFIGNVPKETLVNLTQLRHLNLSHNSLEHLEMGTFSGLINLKSLNLNYNKLASFALNTWFLMKGGLIPNPCILNASESSSNCIFYKLENVYVRGNQISGLDEGSLMNVSVSGTLDLSENLLCQVKNWRNALKNAQIGTLKLNGNPIETLPPFSFYWSSVEVLYLTHLKKLRFVDELAFDGMENLRVLRLSHNRHLKYVSGQAFHKTKSLEDLDLSHNALNSIDQGLIKHLPSLGYIDLRKNPIKCDCNVKWIYKELTTREMAISINNDDSIMKCFPNHLLNETLAADDKILVLNRKLLNHSVISNNHLDRFENIDEPYVPFKPSLSESREQSILNKYSCNTSIIHEILRPKIDIIPGKFVALPCKTPFGQSGGDVKWYYHVNGAFKEVSSVNVATVKNVFREKLSLNQNQIVNDSQVETIALNIDGTLLFRTRVFNADITSPKYLFKCLISSTAISAHLHLPSSINSYTVSMHPKWESGILKVREFQISKNKRSMSIKFDLKNNHVTEHELNISKNRSIRHNLTGNETGKSEPEEHNFYGEYYKNFIYSINFDAAAPVPLDKSSDLNDAVNILFNNMAAYHVYLNVSRRAMSPKIVINKIYTLPRDSQIELADVQINDKVPVTKLSQTIIFNISPNFLNLQFYRHLTNFVCLGSKDLCSGGVIKLKVNRESLAIIDAKPFLECWILNLTHLHSKHITQRNIANHGISKRYTLITTIGLMFASIISALLILVMKKIYNTFRIKKLALKSEKLSQQLFFDNVDMDDKTNERMCEEIRLTFENRATSPEHNSLLT